MLGSKKLTKKKLNVAEIRMLRWISEYARHDRIRNISALKRELG